jgi:hypothetical protein
MQMSASLVRDRLIHMAMDMDMLCAIAMSMPVKMHAVAP